MRRGYKTGIPAAATVNRPTATMKRPGDQQVVTDPGGIDPNTGRVTYADRHPQHYAANQQRMNQQNTFQGATPEQANQRALYAERHPHHAAAMQGRAPQQGGSQSTASPNWAGTINGAMNGLGFDKSAEPRMQEDAYKTATDRMPNGMQMQPYPMPQQWQQLPPMLNGMSGGFGPMQGRPTYDPGFGAQFSPFQNPKFAGPGSWAAQQMGGGMWGGGQMVPARNTGPAPMPTGKGLMSPPSGGMQRVSQGVYRDANGQLVRK